MVISWKSQKVMSLANYCCLSIPSTKLGAEMESISSVMGLPLASDFSRSAVGQRGEFHMPVSTEKNFKESRFVSQLRHHGCHTYLWESLGFPAIRCTCTQSCCDETYRLLTSLWLGFLIQIVTVLIQIVTVLQRGLRWSVLTGIAKW